eukprot:5170232-Alexandrium_andersonii.AAC.1
MMPSPPTGRAGTAGVRMAMQLGWVLRGLRSGGVPEGDVRARAGALPASWRVPGPALVGEGSLGVVGARPPGGAPAVAGVTALAWPPALLPAPAVSSAAP